MDTFEFIDNGGGTFTLSLKPGLSNILGNYQFAVTAYAKGESSVSALGIMKVLDNLDLASDSCMISRFLDMPDLTLDIPLKAEKIDIIFQTYSEYFEGLQCGQRFSAELADGNPLPDYYRLDTITGQLSLENKYYQKIDESIVMVMTFTSPTQEDPIIQKSSPFHIQTICGPESTIIIPPR